MLTSLDHFSIANTHAHVHIHAHTHTHTHTTHTHTHTNRQTDRQTDRQSGRQASRQIERQTDRQTDFDFNELSSSKNLIICLIKKSLTIVFLYYFTYIHAKKIKRHNYRNRNGNCHFQ